MNRTSYILLLFLALCLGARAQFRTSMQVVPADTSVRRGVLENGMTYMIQRATLKEGIADFRLLQRTGSLVEEDNERGMAHMLEHMMFKGTKHFPGQSILDFLRRNGVAFGPDINAFTSWEETRYLLSEVPITKPAMMDSCLTILHDWSAGALIDKQALEAERNVIVEEWRSKTGMTTSFGILADVFKGTRYADRNPIGTLEVINSCTAEQMKAFYHKWYQPQNQCVIVTGDINVDEVEEQVKRIFSDLKRGTTTLPTFALPADNPLPKVLTAKDKNEAMVGIELIIKHAPLPREERMLVKRFKEQRIREIALRILQNRLNRLKQEHPSIFQNTVTYSSYIMTPQADMGYVNLASAPTEYKENLRLLFTELEKAKRFGFTESELRAELSIPEDVKPTDEDTTVINFTTHPTTSNSGNSRASFAANNLISHFLEGTMPVTSEVNSELGKYLNTHITPQMLQEAIAHIYNKENNILTFLLPEDVEAPTEAEIRALYDEVETMELAPETDTVNVSLKSREQMMEEMENAPTNVHPKPGTIVRKTVRKDIGYTEYLLSNGVKVLLNSKPYTQEQATRLRAVVKGGKSLLENDELLYADLIKGISNNLESHDLTFSSGDPVSIDLTESYTRYKVEHWGGGLTFSDPTTELSKKEAKLQAKQHKKEQQEHEALMKRQLEQAFQQFYCRLATATFDTTRFHTDLEILRQQTQLPKNRAQQAMETLASFDLASPDRTQPITLEMVNNVTTEKMGEVLSKLHANYNGMTVIIRTNRKPQELLPFIKEYIASLPSLHTPAQTVERKEYHLKAHDDHHVAFIDNPQPLAQSIVIQEQEEGVTYDATLVAHSEAFTNVLNQLLINNIRIKNSDVYSISGTSVIRQFPIVLHGYPIVFTCAPEKVETINNDVKQLIHGMAEGDLITQTLLDSYYNAKERQAAGETPRQKNDIEYLFEQATNDGLVIDKNDMQVVKSVTITSLRQFTKDLLQKGHTYEFILRTE